MTNTTKNRDLMAPETEPTDAELQTGMKEALDLALTRKQQSDIWMRRQLLETVDQVRNDYQASHP